MTEKLAKKMSPAVVEAQKPEAAPYRVWDTVVPSLFLRIQPSGIKSWNVQWRRESSRSLGKWPGVTVESARTKARAALIETDKHGKPLDVLQAERPKVSTLRDYVEQVYQPWAVTNRKWGDGAAERILTVFAEFADKPLTDIDPLAVEKWRTERVKAGTSQNTCNRDLATIKSALKRALEWRIIESDPLAKVKQAKVDSTRVRYLSDDEEKALRSALQSRDAEGRDSRVRFNQWRSERGLEALPTIPKDGFADHLAPAVIVSLNTGVRRGELTALLWSDIDFDRNVLTVRAAASKSNKSRRIPLNAEALDYLKRWKRQQPAGRVFPFKDAKKAWVAVLADAKITDFRWHDLRHTFASKLVMRRVDLNTVRDLMGHESLAMTLRYAHLAPEHKAAAVDLLCDPKPRGDERGKRRRRVLRTPDDA